MDKEQEIKNIFRKNYNELYKFVDRKLSASGKGDNSDWYSEIYEKDIIKIEEELFDKLKTTGKISTWHLVGIKVSKMKSEKRIDPKFFNVYDETELEVFTKLKEDLDEFIKNNPEYKPYSQFTLNIKNSIDTSNNELINFCNLNNCSINDKEIINNINEKILNCFNNKKKRCLKILINEIKNIKTQINDENNDESAKKKEILLILQNLGKNIKKKIREEKRKNNDRRDRIAEKNNLKAQVRRGERGFALRNAIRNNRRENFSNVKKFFSKNIILSGLIISILIFIWYRFKK